MTNQVQFPNASHAAPILVIDGVSKSYGSKVVADDLHLEIRKGEFFTFLGASGSGKSTTLRIVAGLETADRGTIRISGRSVDRMPPWKRDVGMMFQQYAVFPHMNVAQNIGYGLSIRRMARADIDRRVAELLELVSLVGMGDKNVTQLSGGEQQRVALARALAPEPLILLLDEPLSALDERIRREMQSELKRIQRQTGTTFLYVTHDQEEALTMSDRIVVLQNGCAAQVGAPEDIFLRPTSAFVAKFFRGSNLLDVEVLSLDGNIAEVLLNGVRVHCPRGTYSGDVGPAKVSLRSENIRIGSDLSSTCISLPVEVVDRTFRGTNADWRLRIGDGSIVTATTARHVEAQESGMTNAGFLADDVVLLSQ